MTDIGRLNRLQVAKIVDFGIYLDADELGQILLPSRYVPQDCKLDDWIEVFIYRDSEDLLIASVSSCHMLWYLHLASTAGVVVLGYVDDPVGTGELSSNGAGRFVSVTLQPRISLAPGMDQARADAVHGQIHRYCFIARSLNFPVTIKASYDTGVG